MEIKNKTFQELNMLSKQQLIYLYINTKKQLQLNLKNEKKETKRLNSIFYDIMIEFSYFIWDCNSKDKNIKKHYRSMMFIFHKHYEKASERRP